MLRPLALALLAVLAFLPAPAMGQAAGAALVLEDAAGDVRTAVGGQPAAGGEAAYPGVDLRALTVQETPFSFTFTLQPAALPKESDAGADGVLYSIVFTHNGREFQLRLQMALRAIVVNDNAYADLSFRDTAEADWSQIWGSPDDALVDQAAGTITVDVLRDLFADKDGAAPFPGRSLESLHVRSQSLFSEADAIFLDVPAQTPQSITDAMPDDAPYPALAVQLGLAQTGHARLSSLSPFRASNGEATTFVYNVTATNLADRADTFELEAVSVPNGFAVVLPVPALALEAGENKTVPVLVTIPFGHDHGALSSFTLELRSLSDGGSVGRVEMGVRFLAVPQPAGHHDTVYLHTGVRDFPVALFGDRLGYLNTLAEDPDDQRINDCTSAFPEGPARPGYWHASWPYYLRPGLQMGIDVDEGKVGRLTVPISSTLPALGAQLAANLYIEPPRDDEGEREDMVRIAGMAMTQPEDLGGAGAVTLFEGDLLPVPEAPRVGYMPGRNLVLWLTLIYQGPTAPNLADDGPCVSPGGSAILPLEEWHDPVDEVLAALDGPGLSPLGPQERLVNPGEAVVFPVSIANPLDDDVRVKLEVSGPNAQWSLLESTSVAVPAHGTAQATVVVRAPPGAADGERADLVLQAFPSDDPTSRGLLRLVAEVDTDADHLDDSAIAPEPAGKKSPGVGVPLVIAALAALAAVVRRSRR